jgi:hypothetical protein
MPVAPTSKADQRQGHVHRDGVPPSCAASCTMGSPAHRGHAHPLLRFHLCAHIAFGSRSGQSHTPSRRRLHVWRRGRERWLPARSDRSPDGSFEATDHLGSDEAMTARGCSMPQNTDTVTVRRSCSVSVRTHMTCIYHAPRALANISSMLRHQSLYLGPAEDGDVEHARLAVASCQGDHVL